MKQLKENSKLCGIESGTVIKRSIRSQVDGFLIDYNIWRLKVKWVMEMERWRWVEKENNISKF